MDVEESEEGNFKSVSCPETRCSTPKMEGKIPKGERGSTSSLNKKSTASTFDRITGILASFRDTRKALDESLKKNRELLEYVDGMETPRSKFSFLPSIFGRSAKINSKEVLPFHRNDLRDVREDQKNYESEEILTCITTNDLQAISTEILILEKENEPQAKNVKGASPSTKPKPLFQQHKLNNQTSNRSHKPLNANAKDYGDFDFCVIKEKSAGVKGEESGVSSAPELKHSSDESFPRRRRPINRFQNSTSHLDGERNESEARNDKNADSITRETKGACNICLCALLLSVSLIVFAVLVLLHPSVQIYIRSHILYINQLNSPV